MSGTNQDVTARQKMNGKRERGNTLMQRSIMLLGYGLYSLVLAAVFLWVLFPADFARRWLPEYVHTRYPWLTLQVGQVGLHPIEGLKLDAVRLRGSSVKVPVAELDSITFIPGWSGAVDRPVIRHDARLYQGSATGKTVFHPGEEYLEFSGAINGVQTALSALPELMQRAVSGTLSGQYTAKINTEGGVEDLEVRARIVGGRVGLLQDILGHEELEITSASMSAAGTGKRVAISSGVVDSPLFSADFQGEMELKVPLRSSVLSLTGTLVPRPGFFSNIRDMAIDERVQAALSEDIIVFTITGELGAPSLGMGDMSVLLDLVDNGKSR